MNEEKNYGDENTGENKELLNENNYTTGSNNSINNQENSNFNQNNSFQNQMNSNNFTQEPTAEDEENKDNPFAAYEAVFEEKEPVISQSTPYETYNNPYNNQYGNPYNNGGYIPPSQQYANMYNQQTPAYENVAQKKKNRNGVLFTIGIICLIMCIVSVSVAIGLAVRGDSTSFKFPAPETPGYEYINSVETTGEKLDAPSVIEKVKPSVVLITSQISNGYETGTGMGSGFIISENGIIVTNAHVVDGARSITVRLLDGTEYTAEVLGSDSSSDIAVLKIDATGLPAVEIGDSTKLVEGEEVIAIGHPYSEELSYTSTKGIVSGLRDDFHFQSLQIMVDLIQHDAAINSGNSGGPLVNMYGQVVGINSVKIAGNYDNIGFAIQMSTAQPIIENIINKGSADRPKIGVTCVTDSNVGGVKVVSIIPGGPADLAGLEVDDMITKIDGKRIKTTEELTNYIGKKSVGDTVTITVLRDAETIELQMNLTASESLPQEEIPKTDE